MSAKTVKISNVSLSATLQDIQEFFSFSGDIEYVEMQTGDEWSQVAYVTFKDVQGADTALLLSGATIVDLAVVITPAPEYELPPGALTASALRGGKAISGSESAVQKAENVISSMLAKGFVLGKDAVEKAKAFDEKHQLTSTATAKVSDLDKKIGFTEKISIGTAVVNEKVLDLDNKYHVSDKARTAIAAAEQTVSNAGSVIMKNRYVFTSAAWVTGAFSKVTKAAADVGTKAMEKAGTDQGSKRTSEDDMSQIPRSEASSGPATSAEHPKKPEPAQGLIL